MFRHFFSLCMCISFLLISIGSAKDLSVCIVVISEQGDDIEGWTGEVSMPGIERVYVIVSSESFSSVETRAILPMFPKLQYWYGNDCMWFMFVTPQTEMKHTGDLASRLLQFTDPESNMYYLGHALKDMEPSITHHFLNNVEYPLLCSGFLLSKMVIHRVAECFEKYLPDFSIDPAFELSLFLKYMRFPPLAELHKHHIAPDKDGVTLTNEYCLCSSPYSTNCCTYCSKRHSCDNVVDEGSNDIIFAVKTCQKYHNARLPVLWNTWIGKPPSLNIIYFSDVVDNYFNTVKTRVKNTERGHCSKLLAILHQISSTKKKYSWLAVCDDDTLLRTSICGCLIDYNYVGCLDLFNSSMHVPRLKRYLGCHHQNSPMIIGEMYGYKVNSNTSGYLFPTGGSGMVFNKHAVDAIVESGIMCPYDDYPDDMFIGMISTLYLKIKLIHSSSFHQNQPSSYHPTVLEYSGPLISFHRYTPYDPVTVYTKYLEDPKLISKTEL